MREFDNEPIRGLPERLPKGEHILWQGSPDWRGLARQIFHVRAVTLYFAVIATWLFLSALYDGRGLGESWSYIAWTAIVAAVAVGLLCVLAWAISRTTVYTLTNRRVVMRYGVAFPMALNIPYSQIAEAGLKTFRDGSGNIALQVTGPVRMAYLHLWPHVRPGKYRHAEPMLRALPQAAEVSVILRNAWRGKPSAAEAAPAEAPAPVSRRAEKTAYAKLRSGASAAA